MKGDYTMKKIVWLMCICTALLSFSACSSNAEIEQLKKENEELKSQLATPTPAIVPSEIPQSLSAENITEIKELRWNDVFSNAIHYHNDLVLTNKYNGNLTFTVEALFKDASGNVLGKDTKYTDPVMSGDSTYISLYLDNAEFSDVELTITPKRSAISAIDTSKLEYGITSGGNDTKFVLSMKNNDTVDYASTGAYIVFYNGENVIDVEPVDVSNADHRLLAGATEYNDFTFTDLYTHYEIYPVGEVAA